MSGGEAMKQIVIAALVLMIACAGAAGMENTSAKDLFGSKCAVCHGADGAAKTSIGKSMKIRDFHLPEVQQQSDLKAVISKGKGKMPAFEKKLTAQQIDDLVAYIRELAKK
jgi:cytochrome c6